jgi:hypothetical protein
LKELLQVAFRRSLDDEAVTRYIDDRVKGLERDEDAIKSVLLLALKSPWFLYPLVDMDQSVSRQAANRLALTLYDSLPSNRKLRVAISNDQLKTPDQVRTVAWEMVNDHRVRAKTRAMLRHWLNLSQVGDNTKNEEAYPGFNQTIVTDLNHSLDAFLDAVVWSDASDFRQLFQADWTYTNDRLFAYYGSTWAPIEDAPEILQRSAGDPDRRFGVLSHPLLLSSKSYFATTSPIHRGIFLIRHVLGRELRPPNAAFSPLSPDLHPELTTRQRVALQTSPDSCQVCHSKINSLGFVLESYDAVGRYRDREKQRPIDASGMYIDRNGQEIKFDGPKELAAYLVSSNDCHRAFVENAFEFFVKQPIAAYGSDRLVQLTQTFVDSGYNIRNLIVEIAVLAASIPTPPASET